MYAGKERKCKFLYWGTGLLTRFSDENYPSCNYKWPCSN